MCHRGECRSKIPQQEECHITFIYIYIYISLSIYKYYIIHKAMQWHGCFPYFFWACPTLHSVSNSLQFTACVAGWFSRWWSKSCAECWKNMLCVHIFIYTYIYIYIYIYIYPPAPACQGPPGWGAMLKVKYFCIKVSSQSVQLSNHLY